MILPSGRRLAWVLGIAVLLGSAALAGNAIVLRSLEGRIARLGSSPRAPAMATATWRPSPPVDRGPTSFEGFLAGLRNMGGRVLRTFLERLDGYAERLQLTNEQIDLALEELRRIKTDDPYQEMEWGFKVPHDPARGHLVYVNRRAATGAIEVLGFRKIANGLRSLPLEERVARVMEFYEGRADAGGYAGHGPSWFGGELWRIGNDAVPFILNRAREAPEFRYAYVMKLSQIGDPRAIDFILRTLRETPAEDTGRRCEIIRAASAFRGESVAEALIEAAQDGIRLVGDARQTQRPQPRHEVYPVRFYPVRECAAQALSTVTGRHWGWLFNEDLDSWLAWRLAEDRATFDPVELERSDEALSALLENFTYRCMMGFMRPEVPEGAWSNVASSLKPDLDRLRRLGPRVAPLWAATCRSISDEFPIWNRDLRVWTRRVLTAMNTPESLAAAAELAED